jgi:hypothetical protein
MYFYAVFSFGLSAVDYSMVKFDFAVSDYSTGDGQLLNTEWFARFGRLSLNKAREMPLLQFLGFFHAKFLNMNSGLNTNS